MKLSIMQPYLFPYLGYFHLIQSTDQIVFYDDVNFIKGGWVNRNRLLISGVTNTFTIPISKASPNKKINEIDVALNKKWIIKFLKSLKQSYGKAPFFCEVFKLVESVLYQEHKSLADLSINSVVSVYKYLGLDLNYLVSSVSFSNTSSLNGEGRVIAINLECNAKTYVNVNSGRELYSHKSFSEKGIELLFLESFFPEYPQNSSKFVLGLSILDILMNNSRAKVLDMFKAYKLVL